MSENEDVYIYQRRFIDYSFKEKSSIFIESLKERILKRIATSWFRKRLHPADYFSIENERRKSFGFNNESRIKYSKLELTRVKFFEALDIDDFDNYKAVLLSKFPDEAPLSSELHRESIKDNLDKIKTSLDSISYGGELSYLKFDNKKSADLLQGAHLSYIKTFESYFILCIEVRPSEKFKQIFNSIISADDFGMETIKYNKLLTIFRTGRFVSHSSMGMSTLSHGLDNLVADLNYQVRHNITNHLKGQFYKSERLPRIEHFEVENIEDFHKDSILEELIGNFKGSFSLEDNKIHIFVNRFSSGKNYRLRVLKERGHGKKEKSKSDLTDYDWVETHYLHQALSLPCTLDAILSNQNDELNQLKRKVYDYINDSSKRIFWNKFRILKYSQTYVDLKVSLAKGILTFKRFEEEFSNRNLRIFSRYGNFENFKRPSVNDEIAEDEKDLKLYFETSFNRQIEQLNKRISTLEQVFKPVEDLSVYRVNFGLQVTSIIIGGLAIILTFDKLIPIIVKFYNWLVSY